MLELPDVPWASLDTETSGLHPDDGARVACVAVAWPGGSAALPFDQGERDKFDHVQLDLLTGGEDPNLGWEDWQWFLRWCADRKLIFHNAKYDLTMMRAGTREWVGIDLLENTAWDTMIGQRELDPTEQVGLDVTTKRLGIGGKKGLTEVQQWLVRHKYPKERYDLVPWEIIELYVKTDAEDTRDLYLHQQERYRNEEASLDRFTRQMRLMGTLYKMEQRGVGYDAIQSLEAARLLEQRADEIEKRMPFAVNPNAAKAWFFTKQGLIADRLTEHGNPSLDDEQVRAWIVDGVQWADEYSLVTKARRAVSMWYQGYPDKMGPDGRLRTNFKQVAVKSGRMSVGRVQLQALPKADKYSAVGSNETLPIYEGIPGVREMLRAKEGHGLWSLDLSQAELRVAANYCRCELMLRMLAEGVDFHGRTCEEVLETDPSDPHWKMKRDVAKRLTFGSIFMVGAEKFQSTLSKLANIHWPIEECERAVRRWRQMYPEFGAYYRKADNFATQSGYVRLLPNTEHEVRSYFAAGDRHINYGRWSTPSAWNRIVQGSLAEFFALWMVDVEANHPGYMILTIHDSVLLEAPLDEGDSLAVAVASRGAAMATDLFKIEMKVDTDRWD